MTFVAIRRVGSYTSFAESKFKKARRPFFPLKYVVNCITFFNGCYGIKCANLVKSVITAVYILQYVDPSMSRDHQSAKWTFTKHTVGYCRNLYELALIEHRV